ncbi:g9050 [Coccomyxa viridis]|uniref:G9050 protein n=1 Tax=Coccomyxa viridis TaxID=1274662 RepID=A0ABP1G611_9CHLO
MRELVRCSASASVTDSGDGDFSQGTNRESETNKLMDTESLPENFCMIESQQSVRDFAKLQLEEISTNISARRNKIFLLMEEVRRLRIQQRIKGGEKTREEEVGEEKFPSAVPFLPPLTDATMTQYFRFYTAAVAIIVVFGGLLSPILEVKLGLGGTTYEQFISSMHLPSQLADVDPIVASFCGGAVGVLSTLLVVEVNNKDRQAAQRCVYCEGTGYVTCGACSGSGVSSRVPAFASSADSFAAASSSNGSEGKSQGLISQAGTGPFSVGGDRCGSCSGTGKVMCIACLCTGKKVAREHDIRLDPFF